MLVDSSGEGVPYVFRRFVDDALGIINEFEGLVGMPVLPIIMSPPYRFIDHTVVDTVYSVIRGLGGFKDLAVVLNSAGGNIDEAYLLARHLQGIVSGKLIIYVLRLAKSAASILALAGDELAMMPIAELGPIDQ
ncbi:ATP-dependent Clp protease proteolytic subunit [Vulcanisaeta distributa]|uniref:ATP-dependent Clp protease proteolytic subunit n=1 Tax=Vulcanisaeta distributa TaxID=164451 RepID=UPI0006CF3ACE|nr:ATP-dependent Clp protease proteolytic subunit [Vulcanisaeta distributa]